MSEEKWGYVKLSGDMAISRQSQTAGVFLPTAVEGSTQEVICAPITDFEGDIYYINDEEKKKFIVRNIQGCTYIGPVVDNVLVAAVGEKYAYYDLDFNKISQDYDMVSTMNVGAGGVKIGEKWNIINGEFVLSDGKYYLVDMNGKNVSDEAFEEAELFMSARYAAVKKDGFWDYIDGEGNVLINYTFEDAKCINDAGNAFVDNGRGWTIMKLLKYNH